MAYLPRNQAVMSENAEWLLFSGEGRQEGKIVYLQEETKPSGAHRNE